MDANRKLKITWYTLELLELCCNRGKHENADKFEFWSKSIHGKTIWFCVFYFNSDIILNALKFSSEISQTSSYRKPLIKQKNRDLAFANVKQREMCWIRGESKFEIRTLSVNPTLRGWGSQPFDAKDCTPFLSCTRSKFDEERLTLTP